MQWKVVCIWQPVLTSSMIPPRRSFKALLKAKLTPKKKKNHGHYLVFCCKSHALQFSESLQNHYIWEVCSANQLDAPKTALPAAGIGQQNRANSSLPQCPTTHHTPNTSKVEQVGFKIWPRPPYSSNFSPSKYHFFKHLNNFLQGKCSHHQQEAEDAFQEFVESQSMDFYTTGINQLISHWQKHIDYNGSYFV